ncbi:unnamed protein product [Urochloa decumbens]|uniref:Uncharacterized protein n=1 Tax=Urochloa decumbens TaxID=240449 RepID=A0ABC9BX58_9POAL
MPPGRKKGPSKAQATVEPLTEIERERARTMMRNNQKLESLGLTTLALIVNKSSAKSKRVVREDSGSLYEPDAMEDIEQGVVDKVSENSPPNNLTRSTVVPTGGTRGSKRVMPPVEQDQITRMTRQKTRELSSTQADDLNAANFPTQADEQIQMCDEGEPSAVNDRWIRGRSMGKHLDRLSRGLNTKIPVVIAEGKRRPEAPMQAAKLASESGIIVRQHVQIYTHWKEYKKDKATCEDHMGKIANKLSIDTNNKAVKYACNDLLKCRQRNMRHQLKKAFFDGVPANQVTTTSPLDTMTDDQWKALVDMWSSPKHKEKCAKAKLSRENVRYPQKTGSRCFIAHAHVAKQEKYKDVLPTAIDLFKDTHCSSKTGFSEPIRQAIAQMEAIIAEPAEEGQVQKTPVEAVAQVLPSSSSFLQNVGLEQAAPKRSGKSANVARVEELEAEVEAEKQGSAVLRDKIDSQQDELEALKKKVEESEEAREKQSEEIENLKKQAEENKKQSEETNALLRRLFSLNKE